MDKSGMVSSNHMLGTRENNVNDFLNDFTKNLVDLRIGDFKDFNRRNYSNMMHAMLTNINEYYRRVMVAGTGVPMHGNSENFNNEIDYFSYSDPINYTHYVRENAVRERSGENTTRVVRNGRKVNLYPDDNDLGKFDEKWDLSDTKPFNIKHPSYDKSRYDKSILSKTKKAFKNRQINTLISRFGTNTDPGSNGIENPNDARTAYGLSHGRNLLKKSAESNPGAETYEINGYNNPYCRVWTHHYEYDKLYKTMRPFVGVNDDGTFDGSVVSNKELHNWGEAFKGDDPKKFAWKTGLEKWDKSVFDKNTGFINIAPVHNNNGENIHTKQCMFSIENLAWKDYDPYSFEKALSWEQRGPMGGRIMWFPPYDLKINEATRVNWNSHSFIGRGENVYTYTNTERSGTLSFIMLVDHPSVTDYATWYDNTETTDNDLHRYFAGCDSADPNDPDSLLNKVRPTPLTDEYINADNIITNNENQEEDNNDNPDDISEAIFYVFFPNNYSGHYDSVKNVNDNTSPILSNSVNAISYLLSGIGAQKAYNDKPGDELFKDLITPNIGNYKDVGKGDPNIKIGYEITVDKPITTVKNIDSPDTSQTEKINVFVSKQNITIQDGNEEISSDYYLTRLTSHVVDEYTYDVSERDTAVEKFDEVGRENPLTYHYENFYKCTNFSVNEMYEEKKYIYVDFEDTETIYDGEVTVFDNVTYFEWNSIYEEYRSINREIEYPKTNSQKEFFGEIFEDKNASFYQYIYYNPDRVLNDDDELEEKMDFKESNFIYVNVPDDKVFINNEDYFVATKKINDNEYVITHIGFLKDEPLKKEYIEAGEHTGNKIGKAVLYKYSEKSDNTNIEKSLISDIYQDGDELLKFYKSCLDYYLIKNSWVPGYVKEETDTSIKVEKKFYKSGENFPTYYNTNIEIIDVYENDVITNDNNYIITHFPDKADNFWSKTDGKYVKKGKKIYYRTDGFYDYPKNENDKICNTWSQIFHTNLEGNKDAYFDTKSYGLNSDYKQVIGEDKLENENNKNKIFSFTDVACALSHVYKWPKESISYLDNISTKEKVDILIEKINDLKIKNVKVIGMSNSHGKDSSAGSKRNKSLAENRAKTIKSWFEDVMNISGDNDMFTIDIQSNEPVSPVDVSSLKAKLYRSVKCVITFNKTETVSIDESNNNGDENTDSVEKFTFVMERDGVKYYRNNDYVGGSNDLWYEKNGKYYKVGVINDEHEFTTESLDLSELNNKKGKYNTLRYDQEYHFFKKVMNEQPAVWEKIMDKIKFFNPAFHSMTPEGFNARLTFLHQCTRQGGTNTMSDSNSLTANNLAFGRPPFCVLRLGDFYNQLIMINSIDFDYNIDNGPLWDMNQDGIGMQPLLCRVNMQITFIGGGDIAGPVRRLQNANSFNYYGNTSLYDNRADNPKYDFDNVSNIGTLDKNNSTAYVPKLRSKK